MGKNYTPRKPGRGIKANLKRGSLVPRAHEDSEDEEIEAAWLKRLKLGAVILVILIAVGSLIVVGRKEGASRSSVTDKPDSTVLDADYDPGSATDWKGPLPGEIARRFSVATTHAERMKYIRDPEHNAGPMKAFFEEGPGAREKVVGVRHLGLVKFETLSVEGFQAELDNGKSRLLGVVLTPEGGLVDFRSYARYGSENWSDLLGGTVTEAAEVRVHLKPAFEFFGSFADDEIWRNFVATSPDLEDPLYFYVKLGSKAADELEGCADGGQRVTLAIRASGESHRRRQFEVTEVLSLNWVIPTKL